MKKEEIKRFDKMMRTRINEKELVAKERGRKLIGGAMTFLFVFILLFNTFYIVPAGYRGVQLTFGKPSMDVIEEGIHLKAPFIQNIVKMEVRTQKIETSADAASKDLQDVQTTIALNYHLATDEVPLLYQTIGKNYQGRIIDPAVQEAVRAVSAKYTAEELITKRALVRDDAKQFLKDKLGKYYIMVDDFNIINFQFSESFDAAIEDKVTAEQLKLKAQWDLERIKVEKEQMITQAQAQAESLRLQKMEVTSDLIRLREIEARLAAIEKWDGVLPQVTGGAIPLLDLGMSLAPEVVENGN